MLLTLDIGNSAIKGAVFAGEHILRTFRLAHESNEMPIVWMQGLYAELHNPDIRCIGIASVVPMQTNRIVDIVRDATGREPVVVSPKMRLPFAMGYETPETLGADRLAAAAAAWVMGIEPEDRKDRATVVIDAGTALTFEVVDRGTYLGGIIAPGPGLQLDALSDGTAQLPEVEPQLPARVVGRSSREAIQSGVMLGFIEATRGLLARICTTLPPEPVIMATGGWAELLASEIPTIQRVEPDLVLHGIRVLLSPD